MLGPHRYTTPSCLLLALALCAVLLANVATAAVPQATAAQAAVRLLVTFADVTAANAALLPNARRLSARIRAVDAPATRVGQTQAELRALPGVIGVDVDAELGLQAIPDDPDFPQQWTHQQAGAPQAWDVTTGTPVVRVAVLDSGIDATNPDLAQRVGAQYAVVDGAVTATWTDPDTGLDNDACAEGHGTRVAGIIGAQGNNAIGVAGVAWDVTLIDIAITRPPRCKRISYSNIVAALDFTVSGPGGPVDIANLSVGGIERFCPVGLQAAIDDARAAGVVVVAAAGNEQRTSPGQVLIPGACNGVIAVGATARDGTVANYSTVNPYVDLVAPGGLDDSPDEQVLTTARDPQQPIVGTHGTSFSVPYVAGIAALLRSQDPGLTPAQIEAILEATAVDLGPEGRDEASGWGLVQAGAALQSVADGQAAQIPEPDPTFPVGVDVDRLWAGAATTATGPAPPTTAITQAVAASQAAFPLPGSASAAILARGDDFADALAGSLLVRGDAPLLYSDASGLPAATRQELQRAVPAGAAVDILGGVGALPASVDTQLQALGYVPRRLAGPTREDTAAEIARAGAARGLTDPEAVILATRGNWPDAVAAGALAANFGFPILLTPAEQLHPATQAALGDLAPTTVLVVGGTGVVTQGVAQAAGDAAAVTPDNVIRLAGPTRDTTAVAIAQEVLGRFDGPARSPNLAVLAVNVDRIDGFAHILSATPLARRGGVFLPVRGQDGDVLTAAVSTLAVGLGLNLTLVGGPDLLSQDAGDRLRVLLSDI